MYNYPIRTKYSSLFVWISLPRVCVFLGKPHFSTSKIFWKECIQCDRGNNWIWLTPSWWFSCNWTFFSNWRSSHYEIACLHIFCLNAFETKYEFFTGKSFLMHLFKNIFFVYASKLILCTQSVWVCIFVSTQFWVHKKSLKLHRMQLKSSRSCEYGNSIKKFQ